MFLVALLNQQDHTRAAVAIPISTVWRPVVYEERRASTSWNYFRCRALYRAVHCILFTALRLALNTPQPPCEPLLATRHEALGYATGDDVAV